jgi:hypothetical protein
MESTLRVNPVGEDAPQSAFGYVGGQIAALVERYDLHDQRALVMQTYTDLCADSLAFPLGARLSHRSRINHDGTPLQYALTLGAPVHTLQFLSEAGGPEVHGAARMEANRACIAKTAQRFQVSEALASITPVLDVLAPVTDVDLLAEEGGAYWEGVAFSPARAPALRVYTNARWGKEQARWVRLSQCAAFFGASAAWAEIAGQLAADLQPLGVAITLQKEQPTSARLYLSAYGKPMTFYEALAEQYGGAAFQRQLSSFGRYLLGEDYFFPTPTAVCSFGIGDGRTPDFKFELCAHCLFPSDAAAAVRLRQWCESAQLDATAYQEMLDLLAEGHLSDVAPVLHCYVGLGLQHGVPYATLYLKPQLTSA